MIVFVKNVLEHLRINLFNFSRYLKSVFVGYPRQYFVLILNVSGVDERVFVPEESQRGEVLDSVFLCEASVFGCYKDDTSFVQFIVNVLKLQENVVALFSLLAVTT